MSQAEQESGQAKPKARYVVPANEKRAAFARAFFETGHATKAAIAAGYSERTAVVAGSRLLRDANVKSQLAAMRQQVAERCEVSQADVVRYLVEDRLQAKALGQLGPAIRADELLGKRFGMFIDRSIDLVVSVTDAELIQRLADGDPQRAAAVTLLLGKSGFDK